jgi:hypothetical protein
MAILPDKEFNLPDDLQVYFSASKDVRVVYRKSIEKIIK